MHGLMITVHILVAIFLVIVILLQSRNQGAEMMGTAFGNGASQTIFGSQGSTSFLTKTTAILGICFAMTSIYLSPQGLGLMNQKTSSLVNIEQHAQLLNIEENSKQHNHLEIPD